MIVKPPSPSAFPSTICLIAISTYSNSTGHVAMYVFLKFREIAIEKTHYDIVEVLNKRD